MIATILKSSKTFAAVDYNEKKVKEGKAELLSMENFITLQGLHNLTGADFKDSLMEWSQRNDRIKYPQFHVAISCKGKEYTKEQLLDIAHQWLKKMGYEGNPTLLYFHHDTDNNHLHIITSRVDSEARKIEHDFERVRSQQVLDEIMNRQPEEEINKLLNDALAFNYQNMAQFQAIFKAQGYQCYQVGDELCLKKGGITRKKVPIQLIKSNFKPDSDQREQRRKQLHAIFVKYKDMASSREELQQMLKDKFGISIVFNGPADNPTGYTVVDNAQKMVFKGNDIMKMAELMNFQSREERFNSINIFIEQALRIDNTLTTKQLNALLRKQLGTYISRGAVHVGNETRPIDELLLNTLKYNDKVAWVQNFHPSSQFECNILGRIYHINPAHLSIDPANTNPDISVLADAVRNTVNASDSQNIRDNLEAIGIRVYEYQGLHFAVSRDSEAIFTLEGNSIDCSIFDSNSQQEQQQENDKSISLGDIAAALVPNIHAGSGAGGGGNSRDPKRKRKGDWAEKEDEKRLGGRKV